MGEIAEALGKGGWGVAALALGALTYVWKWALDETKSTRTWANTELAAVRAELKTLNDRAWAIVDRAQQAKQNAPNGAPGSG